MHRPSSTSAPEFVKNVTADHGGPGRAAALLHAAADGAWPTATTQWEKRNIALEIRLGPEHLQCGKCAFVCPRGHPHEGLSTGDAGGAPKPGAVDYKSNDLPGMKYTVQVAPEDCTGCGLCVEACPARTRASRGSRPSTWPRSRPSASRARQRSSWALPELGPHAADAQQCQELAAPSSRSSVRSPAPAAARRLT